MAGQLRGIVEQRLYFDGADTSQAAYINMYRTVQQAISAGFAELVALQYGAGGTGMDFYDGDDPCGDNSFFVFRLPPTASRPNSIYILVQWSGGTNFGTAPGAPGLVQAGTGINDGVVGISAASSLDGAGADESPWNGTSNADGADAKGTPVWATTGQIWHFPRSNATGGTHAASTQNTVTAFRATTDPFFVAQHCVVDEDFFCVMTEDPTTWDLIRFVAIGPMGLLSDDMDCEIPLCAINDDSVPATNSTIGDTSGGGIDQGSMYRPRDNATGLFEMADLPVPTNLEEFYPNGECALANADVNSGWWLERGINLYSAEVRSGHAGRIRTPDGPMWTRLSQGRAILRRVNGEYRRAFGPGSNSGIPFRLSFRWGANAPAGASKDRNGISIEAE